MKVTTQIACAVALAFAASTAYAVQLGPIQVKSALNQPLVAAIPLHPKNLTELNGLTVRLAPESAYQRAGLQLTAADSALRFHVVTDNNGQKLILVTSAAPVTDPYLDFLVEVDTHSGKQVKEFVVLLNPVIAAPAPEVQQAPMASTPAAAQSTQLPPASAFPQASAPEVQGAPARQPAEAPTQQLPPPPLMPIPAPIPQSNPAAQASAPGTVAVQRGDTLFHIASQAAQANGGNVDQMMLALLAANPKAFRKHNINNLQAGAILRIPTRDQLNQTSLAAARAEVRRQNEAWRASKPTAPTEVAGAAATAAAATAPKPTGTATQSDHLAVVPPSTGAGGATNRPGVAGGTGHESVAGLRAELQNAQSSLASVQQSNADLQSRVADLKDIAAKSNQLLSMKASTVAELQDKLAKVQAHKPALASATAQAKAPASATPWYGRPWTWVIAAIVAVLVILLGLLRLRRGRPDTAALRRVLADPADVTAGDAAAPADEPEPQIPAEANELQIWLDLCRDYYEQHHRDAFIGAAHSMHEVVTDPGCVEWREVLVMGAEIAPGDPLFHQAATEQADDDPYGLNALRAPAAAANEPLPSVPAEVPTAAPVETLAPPTDQADDRTVVRSVPRAAVPAPRGGVGDPVDTKLDLARAYIDMGDAVGARTMLDEVLVAGSQMQRDEARRLLDGLAG